MNQAQKLFHILLHEIKKGCLNYLGEKLNKAYDDLISEIKKHGCPAEVCDQVLTAVFQKLIQLVPAKRKILTYVTPIAASKQGEPVSELPEDIKQKVKNLKERVGEAKRETKKLEEEICELMQIVKFNISAGAPVLIDKRRLSWVDHNINRCNRYVEEAFMAYKEIESALHNRLIGFGLLAAGPIVAVVGGTVGAVAGLYYGLSAAAAAVTGTAAAGAATEVAVATTAVAATGTGAGVAGGAATGTAGKIGLAVAGTSIGVGQLVVGGQGCYELWNEFCNWSAHLQQVETEIDQELQGLKKRLTEQGIDARYVMSQANV